MKEDPHAELARLEREYASGSGRHYAAIDALFVCTKHVLPLPDWAQPLIIEAILHYYGHTWIPGPPKRGRYASLLAMDQELEKHQDRFNRVAKLRQVKTELSLEESFEIIADDLDVSASTIRDSYYRINNGHAK